MSSHYSSNRYSGTGKMSRSRQLLYVKNVSKCIEALVPSAHDIGAVRHIIIFWFYKLQAFTNYMYLDHELFNLFPVTGQTHHYRKRNLKSNLNIVIFSCHIVLLWPAPSCWMITSVCFWKSLFVCLSVCLFGTLLKTLWTDYDETVWRGPGW